MYCVVSRDLSCFGLFLFISNACIGLVVSCRTGCRIGWEKESSQLDEKMQGRLVGFPLSLFDLAMNWFQEHADSKSCRKPAEPCLSLSFIRTRLLLLGRSPSQLPASSSYALFFLHRREQGGNEEEMLTLVFSELLLLLVDLIVLLSALLLHVACSHKNLCCKHKHLSSSFILFLLSEHTHTHDEGFYPTFTPLLAFNFCHG